MYKYEIESNILVRCTREDDGLHLSELIYDMVTDEHPEFYAYVPEGVIAINPHAFENVDVLKVFLPKTCTSIHRFAFVGCEYLEYVEAPGVEFVFTSAFDECAHLETFVGDNLLTIGAEAFRRCYSLKSINYTIPAYIGPRAFSECISLEVNQPMPNLEYIGKDAFEDCFGHITKDMLPPGVTYTCSPPDPFFYDLEFELDDDIPFR